MTEDAKPPEDLLALAELPWGLQVLNAAAALGIPDRLVGGVSDAATLARAAHADEASVYRLLRALTSLGVCRAEGSGFALTEAGAFLRADAPNSIRGPVMFSAGMLWKQFGDLAEVVQTGKPAKSIAAGAEGFAALKDDPVRLHAFQLSMAASSVLAAADAVKAYDFSRYRRVLDLGGGYGAVLAVMLQTYPALQGAVCDLDYLADGATNYLRAAGVADRARFIPGNFFESVPAEFDCYVLKYIVHDWNDGNARILLKHCAVAARPNAKVILLERIVPDVIGTDADTRAIVRSDLTMLTVGGKERTRAEYEALLSSAGLRLTRIVPAGPFSLIESEPARAA